MSIVDTVRPVSVRKTGGGTSVPSGTLAAVTSDNSDATYINFTSGSNWSLRVGSHTPSAGYGRHQARARIRVRTDTGTAYEDLDLGRGTEDFIVWDAVPVTSAFTDQAGTWRQNSDLGLATAGALDDLNIGGGYPSVQSGGMTALRTAECYVDIDCRAIPDFSPQVRDNAGVDKSGGVVTDTDQPVMYFGTVSYDGLPALDWSAAFGGIVFASGGGAPPSQITIPVNLADGAYTATFVVRSTIRGADPHTATESINFSVANTVPAPSPPLLVVEEESGGYRVTWTYPGGQMWDNDYVVAEVWRTDCFSTQRIATVPDGLYGSYLDLAIPQLDPIPAGVDCEPPPGSCDITYSVRYFGYVSVSVELPSTIPDDLILAWPSTVGTIPSGWSRVTALDGFYPRGSSGTGVPTGVTGGAASHSHTTPGHLHFINAHSHTVGGSTGTSNSSTTSARFNGASQSQADQPHSHSRPASTGSAGPYDSGSASPGTNSANNTPPTRDVIWIASNGAQASYPVGILGWATESVSGWVDDATSSGRFLKGAAAAGNGGATSGASTHTHTVASHSHTGRVHDHSIGNTGLSNPASSVEAGFGSSTPRWLPRHTHPMNVDSTTTGDTSSDSGGVTSSADLEPPNKRLRTLRNTGGGIQTRIIGLYVGTVAALDPLLTLCNGAGGTPDMRTWFARDAGSDSVNSTGGTSAHNHTTPQHGHDIAGHTHTTDVLASGTGSFEAPSSGDLGSSPTTGHTHSSGNTGQSSPDVNTHDSGTTNTVSHVPSYKEVHFVRLDGTISGDPLAVPELRVTEYSTVTVPSFTYTDGLDRIANFTDKMAIVTTRTYVQPRLVTDSTPLDGGLHTVSAAIPGQDMTLSIAVEGRTQIDRLEELMSAERVYLSPLGGQYSSWYAPQGWTVKGPAPGVKVLTVTMVRQPWPSTADPEDYL